MIHYGVAVEVTGSDHPMHKPCTHTTWYRAAVWRDYGRADEPVGPRRRSPKEACRDAEKLEADQQLW